MTQTLSGPDTETVQDAILAAVRKAGGMTFGEITTAVGLSASTSAHHVGWLTHDGDLAVDRYGVYRATRTGRT